MGKLTEWTDEELRGYDEKYCTQTVQERVIDSGQAGWDSPHLIVKHQDKYYYVPGLDSFCSKEPIGTMTMRLDWVDSGLVATVHPDEVHWISKSIIVHEHYTPVTLKIEELEEVDKLFWEMKSYRYDKETREKYPLTMVMGQGRFRD